jgi:hypothetical protein
MTTTFLRWLLTTLAATILQAVAGMVFIGDRIAPPPGSPGTLLAWSLCANGLSAAVLLGLASHSRWTGLRSMLALFAVAFGVGSAVNLLEAVVFDVMAAGLAVRALLMFLVTSAILCALVAALTRHHRPHDSPGSEALPPPPAVWRFAAVAALYVVTYFTAGTLVYPFIEDFYRTVTVPPRGVVALLQLLVRGPFFAAIAFLLLRYLTGSPWAIALWTGAAFSIVGGIAPLLVPNSTFPDAVRWAHLVEVSVSNFAFGVAASLLLSARPAPALAASPR